MGQLKTDDLGWQLSFTPAQIDHIYSELSQTERVQTPNGLYRSLRVGKVKKLANSDQQLRQNQ
jgi:hypothetical protein